MEKVAAEDLCTHIRRTEQALTAHHEAVLRRYGLTLTQYTVLLALSRQDEGMSGAQLARACGVTQQTMASVLSGLQHKTLVAREPSPTHAKVLVATLTRAGRTALDGAYEQVSVLEQAFAQAFTPEEQATLDSLLGRARTVLTEQTQQNRAAPSGS